MSQIEKIIVTTLQYDCRFCPTCLIGTTEDGHTIYVRYRWGCLSVRLDLRDLPPNEGAEGRRIYQGKIGGDYDGCLYYADLIEHTKHIIEWPTEPD